MEILKRNKGQTLVETAFVLIILLLIVLGITEFARAWYIKSSMKNAARQGARVAAVTPSTSFASATGNPCTESFITCDENTTCPNGDAMINAICCQPGVPKKYGGTDVDICCKNDTGGVITCNTIAPGDEIQVVTSAFFNFIVGGSTNEFWPWSDQTFTADATMRYE
jgi:hypothetical protein